MMTRTVPTIASPRGPRAQTGHVAFSGGVTGGHLFPGLAVAERLATAAPGLRITFVGCGRPLEREQVEAAGFHYITLPSRPLPRRPGDALSFVVQNMAGYLTAWHFLDRMAVDAVVGLGGYASVPMARAARACGVPLLLLEQNLVPGRATRWLSRRADAICVAFEPTATPLRRCRGSIHVTGTPIRAGFTAPCSPRSNARATPFQPAQHTRRILVLGGSGGAEALNQSVPRAFYRIRKQLEGWTVHHQTGPERTETTETLYRKFGLVAQVEPYINHMHTAMAAAELAICRSGGSTLAELAATGTPAVLVPYPEAADNHQTLNAQWFCKSGAARLVDQRQAGPRLDIHLAATTAELLSSTPSRTNMAAAMRALARPDAADLAAELVLKLVEQHGSLAEIPTGQSDHSRVA